MWSPEDPARIPTEFNKCILFHAQICSLTIKEIDKCAKHKGKREFAENIERTMRRTMRRKATKIPWVKPSTGWESS